MESRSDTTEDSSQVLGSWDSVPRVESEGIIMVSVPTSQESDDARSNPPKEVEKEIETRVSDKERDSSTSTIAGGDKEETARRVLPPWVDPSYEWGGGKWKIDGRKNKKVKEKRESDEIPFKEIMEALLRNSCEKVEEDEDKRKSQNYVDLLKGMGLKFP